MMTPYLLIVLINFQVAVIEFPSASSCVEGQQEVSEKLKDMKNAGAFCYKKLGGLERQS